MRKLRLEGNTVYLEETAEKYFPYIIAWRNDPLNNRYLNQPFLLDMENRGRGIGGIAPIRRRDFWSLWINRMTRRLPRWAGQIIFLRRDCASRGACLSATDVIGGVRSLQKQRCSLRTICTAHLAQIPVMHISCMRILHPCAIMKNTGFIGIWEQHASPASSW